VSPQPSQVRIQEPEFRNHSLVNSGHVRQLTPDSGLMGEVPLCCSGSDRSGPVRTGGGGRDTTVCPGHKLLQNLD